MKKLSEYVFDYINGELDKKIAKRIEDDEEIMLMIISRKKDFKYYEKASDRLKGSYSFVSKIINIFSPEEVATIAETYTETTKDEFLKSIEILCLVEEVYDRTKAEELEVYVDELETFYMMANKDIAKEVLKSLGEVVDSRDEFALVDEAFEESPIIVRFFAKRRLDEYFLYGPMNSYEEFIHANFRSKEDLLEKGFNTFLLEILYELDDALADYVYSNISILDRYKDLNEEVLENWDTYLRNINEEKINDIGLAMLNYIDENHLKEYYFGFLPYIVSKTPYEEVFRKYSEYDLDIIREPKEFNEKRFCELFIDKINRRFAKDTLFGEEYYDKEEKCEIIKLEKVRKKK